LKLIFRPKSLTKNPAKKADRKERKLDSVKADSWGAWLKRNHSKEPGVWVVFPKKSTNEPSISYEESLDIALAYGWIDISIRRIDERTFGRKFTPRRAESSWTEANIKNAERLKKEGKMTEWGLAAFERRLTKKSQGGP